MLQYKMSTGEKHKLTIRNTIHEQNRKKKSSDIVAMELIYLSFIIVATVNYHKIT